MDTDSSVRRSYLRLYRRKTKFQHTKLRSPICCLVLTVHWILKEERLHSDSFADEYVRTFDSKVWVGWVLFSIHLCRFPITFLYQKMIYIHICLFLFCVAHVVSEKSPLTNKDLLDMSERFTFDQKLCAYSAFMSIATSWAHFHTNFTMSDCLPLHFSTSKVNLIDKYW